MIALLVFATPAPLFFALPASLLAASFWRPKIATYGLATLVGLFVVLSILNPGPPS